MTSEREQSHAQANQDISVDRDDAGVGRVSRSAQLHAPASPVASGLLSRKAERDGNGVAAGAEHAVASAQSSSGSALPDTLMRKFEQSLGADLSSVRVHTGGASEEASHAVGAKAYTMGQDIHFGAGHYDPHSDQGQHLLAHEVAHTVQQGGGAPHRQNKLEVSTPYDAAEHEADSAAAAMVSGRPFAVTMGAGVQRKIFRQEKPFSGASYARKGPEGSDLDNKRQATMTVGVYTQEYDNTCLEAATKIYAGAKTIYSTADAVDKKAKDGTFTDNDLLDLAKQVRNVGKALEGMKKGWDTLKQKNFDFSKTKIDNDPELPSALAVVKSMKDSAIQAVDTQASLSAFQANPSRDTAKVWADNIGKQFTAAKSVVAALPFPPGCGWMKDYFTGLLGAPAAYIAAFQVLAGQRYDKLDKDIGYRDGSQKLYDPSRADDVWVGGGPLQKLVAQAYTAPNGLALYNWLIKRNKQWTGPNLEKQPLEQGKAIIVQELTADESTAESRDGWVTWIDNFKG